MKARLVKILLVASILVFLVGCPGLFEKPLTLSIPDQEVLQGETLEIELGDYVSGGRGTLVFTIEDGVGDIDGSTYTYTPGYDVFDNQTVKIRVKDDRDESVEDTFAITVEDFEVEFEDENLEQVVREVIDKPEGELFKSDVLTITHLNVIDRGVAHLGGIENLENLVYFRLRGHTVEDLSPLSGLTGLQYLQIDLYPIPDYSPLSSLVNVEQLFLQAAGVSDLSFVSEMTSLAVLRLVHNNISDVSPLLGLEKLEWLYLQDNPTGFIDSELIQMAPLKGIGFDMYQVFDYETVKQLGQLVRLEVFGGVGTNKLQDLELIHEFDNLDDLRALWLTSHEIQDIAPLSELPFLEILRLSRNRVTSIEVLHTLGNLRSVQLDYNLITDISPLVANENIGSGNYVDIRWNYLDLTPGSQNMNDIEALLDRGVNLQYDPQRDSEEDTGASVNTFYLDEHQDLFITHY